MIKTKYIEPKDTEKELKALWKKHQGTNTIRASLFNLIIYAKKDFRESYLKEIAKNIIRKFPCRMILITEFEETKESFLRTYVSDIKPDETENSIYCDIINFEVAGKHKERIPFIVLPHLLSDRPVYLLWGDDPTKQDPVSLKLENFATRTVFDSETTEHLTQFAETLTSLQKTANCNIGDLNWARIAPWRSLFAHTFNSPEKLECLQKAKHIHLHYNAISSDQFHKNKIQSTYFQAWLAVKMGWNFVTAVGTKEEIAIKYQSEHGPVNITLCPRKNKNVPPGRILHVDLISHHNEHMTFDRNPSKPHQIIIHHTTSNSCEIPIQFLLDKENRGKSLVHEIYNQGTSDSFIKALNLIKNFKTGMICS